MKWLIVCVGALLSFFLLIGQIQAGNVKRVSRQSPIVRRVTATKPVQLKAPALPAPRTPTPPKLPAAVPSKEKVVVATPQAEVGPIEQLIAEVWTTDTLWAVRVARCESGLRPNARNGSHVGLFQLSTRYHSHRISKVRRDGTSLYDPLTNILVARDLYLEQGRRPWYASRKCWS